MTDTAQNTIFRPGHGHCELPLGFSLTELGPLPDHWTVAPLSSVINEVDRTAAETVTDPNELPVLSLTKNDGLILQTERFGKRIATNDVRKYKVVRRSQIVYNPYVIWEGAVHMLRHYEIGLVSPVYVVWQAKENAEPEYIDHLLRTPLAITAYNRLAAGAVNRRRSIRKNDFLAIQIPLPPLDEQKAIARVLRTLRRAAEATNSVIGAAHELKNSLMRHLFSFGPLAVHEAAKRVLNEGSVGAISEHWGVGAIGDYITECQYGLNIRGLPAARYAILRMNNLQDGRIDAHDLKYVDLDARSLEKFHLKSGDLLFNRTNSADLVGKTAVFDQSGEFVFASYLIRFRVDPERVDPLYLNYYLAVPQVQTRLRSLASRGVSQSNINATKLKSFEIPLPPINEQKRIVEILRTVDNKIRAESQRLSAFSVVFDSLSRDLASGSRTLDQTTVAQEHNGARS